MPLNVKATLLKASNLARKGELEAAAQLYRAVLEQFPANGQARSGLAALAKAAGGAGASGAQPSERELMNLINLFNGGHLQQVLEQGGRLVSSYPQDPLIHNLLGAASAGLERHENAIASFRKAIKLKPDYAEAWRNLGAVFNKLARNREAIDCYTRAIKYEAGSADAHYNLGNALRDSGKREEAVASYEKALGLQSGYVQAYNNLGNLLGELGRYDEAIHCLRAAVEYKPDHAEAYNNLGNLYDAQGDVEQALACFGRAIEINPGYAESYSNMASVLHKMERFDEAIASCRRAIELRPAYVDAYNNLGCMLLDQGEYRQAVGCLAAALKMQPGFANARAQMLNAQAYICDWVAIQASVPPVAELGLSGDEVVPFSMLSLEDSPGRHLQRSSLYAENRFHFPEAAIASPPQARPERLRIGYFSADFHDHATLYLMIGLLEQHDSDSFVVHAFSYGPDRQDAMRRRLQSAVDFFHDVRGLSDGQIAELARSEGIDIAIDLKGYTRLGRVGIFARRAAPVQVSYLGYPGTLGLPAMDYIIADPVTIPEEQRKHYSESIIYLPHSYQANDRGREISDRAVSREEMGLPTDAFVFCCFNNNYKIGAREFDVWMRLLQRIEGSVLWLLESNSEAAKALLEHAQQRGVEPSRIILAQKMPLAEHLARHRLADLFLDCFNYNAHTTASDALWAGLPLVTLQGQGFSARVAASLLTAVGLPELVTHSVEEYEALALALASNPQQLGAVRDKLAANRLATPLFDTGMFTRHLEQAYEKIYRIFLDGDCPQTVRIPA